MFFEEFHDAFDKFQRELVKRLDISDRTWSNQSAEMYDHKRTREFGVWCIEGGQRFGYVFSASSFSWNGYVDWTRILAICENPALAIVDDDQTRIWDLAKIESQQEPLPRCQKCGLITETRQLVIDEALQKIKKWWDYEKESIGRMPNARRADPEQGIRNVLLEMKK